MKTTLTAPAWKFAFLVFCLTGFSSASHAQGPVPRITRPINDNQRVVLSGTRAPYANPANYAGRVPTGTVLHGMNLVFAPSAAQRAGIKALIAAQQDPSSSLYHQWLTPDQFGARFGVADADIAKVEGWLQSRGFTVDGISHSRTRITFSGTVSQVEAAFRTQLHYYKLNGQTPFAPSTDLSVPAAFSGMVQAVTNLSSLRPHSHMRKPPANFTSSQSGNHFLSPADVATIYDITPAYNAGFTGAGQSIVVVGQSSVALADIENFQTAAGLPIKDPTLVLAQNTGNPAIYSGDESESDLDLEYSGSIAKGASIFFDYAGDNLNTSVLDALADAIDRNLAPIISISYGLCETELASSDYSSLNMMLARAAMQNQTVVAASGDSGSTDCYGFTNLTTTQQEALAVDFPASSEYVTGMGGSEFPSADVDATNTTYWQSASGSDVLSSALSYIPEQVWNDDSSSSGISSGGGGVSTFTLRPAWQTGVPGIPTGTFRLVPDISLTASPANAGFLYCSSDFAYTQVSGSCTNGFRDSAVSLLTVAGGTSFDAPIYAGLQAIINQKENSTGQGVVNSTLYSLASNAGTYASAFHDITTGSNACTAGTTYCSTSGASQYSATTGYDQATGLGSIDFMNLLNAWPASGSSSLSSSITTLSPATSSPASGATDSITITVAPGSASSTVPTGIVTIAIDGADQSPMLTLSSGSATYSFSSSTTGSHIVTAKYAGDSTYAASNGTAALNVGTTNTGGFSVDSPATLSITSGTAGTTPVSITPNNGYNGTVAFTVSSTPTLTNGCYAISNATISGNQTLTTSLTINTTSSACSAAAARKAIRASNVSAGHPFSGGPTLGLMALAFAGVFAYRPRKLRKYAGLIIFAVVALTWTGCGGGGTTTTVSSDKAPQGTYTLTITGTDTVTSTITASTTTTLTIN